MDNISRNIGTNSTLESPSGMTTLYGADERDVIFTRIFNAPRELVFKAWTDAELLAQWWGPHGMTNHDCTIDLRRGGAYRIVMRSPEGVDFPVKGNFLDIVESSRLVMSISSEEHPDEWHAELNKLRRSEDGRPLEFMMTLTFDDIDGRTKLSILSRFRSADDRDAVLKMGSIDGWAQSLDKLDALLSRA